MRVPVTLNNVNVSPEFTHLFGCGSLWSWDSWYWCCRLSYCCRHRLQHNNTELTKHLCPLYHIQTLNVWGQLHNKSSMKVEAVYDTLQNFTTWWQSNIRPYLIIKHDHGWLWHKFRNHNVASAEIKDEREEVRLFGFHLFNQTGMCNIQLRTLTLILLTWC